MIKAIIFDLDGLLANTEILHYKAYKTILSNYGIQLNKEDFILHWTTLGLGISEFLQHRGLNFDANKIRFEKLSLFEKLLDKNLNPMPFAIEKVKEFKSDYILIIASSSIKHSVYFVLEKLDLLKYFDLILSRDDVKKPKPDPEIYKLALNHFKLNYNEAVVIEDSSKGCKAAISIDIKAIAVPNEFTINDNFTDVSYILDTLEDLNNELIQNLWK